MFAKKIELFLMDGAANGRWACELSNWSGKAYKISRTLLSESKDRPDLVSTGVYFLLGKRDSLDEKERIYIGEAENLFERLKQHLGGKDFWNEVIVFLSKDEPGTEQKEKVFIKAARGADACGQSVTDGFVVFAGSRAAKEIAPAFEKHNYLSPKRVMT